MESAEYALLTEHACATASHQDFSVSWNRGLHVIAYLGPWGKMLGVVGSGLSPSEAGHRCGAYRVPGSLQTLPSVTGKSVTWGCRVTCSKSKRSGKEHIFHTLIVPHSTVKCIALRVSVVKVEPACFYSSNSFHSVLPDQQIPHLLSSP